MALASRHLATAAIYRDPATAFRFRAGVGAEMVNVNNSTSGPRPTCRSAATAAPAAAAASPASGSLASSPAGRR